MLSRQQIDFYNDQGYLVLERVLSEGWLGRLRQEIARLVEGARGVTANDSTYDLEDSHRPDAPRVRRIKQPHTVSAAFAELVRDPAILAPVRDLLGPSLRFKGAKLNMKSAGYGAPVEWHQDWAFYPHTNDDVLAVGVMLDEVTGENGPLMVLPGSHRGPTYDHHDEGYFCGALDPARDGIDLAAAVRLTAPAGSISLHHVRLVHGSDLNRSGRDRRMLFYEITAADAWPLCGTSTTWTDLEAYDAQLLCGEPTTQPRLVPAPIRIPLPKRDISSIYQAQKGLGRPYFEHLRAAG